MEAGQKIRIEARVIAEVAKSQMGQMHLVKMNSGRDRREIFPGDVLPDFPARGAKFLPRAKVFLLAVSGLPI